MKQSEVTEQGRTEIGVMSRRSILVFGTSNSGRFGVGNFWLQDGIVVAMSISAPESSTDLGYSWGQILSTITPLNALEFGDTRLTSPTGDFTISYPKDWFLAKDQPGAVVELESDLSKLRDPEGAAIVIVESKLSDLGDKVTDMASLQEFMRTVQKWDDTIIPSEHIILDQPAVTFAGKNEAIPGGWGVITAFIWNDTAVFVATAYPSEEKFTELLPTHIAMLQTIKATASTS
jgi:hypothetical protein